jgi:hypothetical protein
MTLIWEKGGTAEIVAVDGETLVVRSTIPSPPGSRLAATLGDTKLNVKVHGSKREEDGTFTIKGRLVDATRAVREKVAAAAAAAQNDGDPEEREPDRGRSH